jgi:hypothetical protein
MMCPTCKRRQIAKGDTVCRTCRRFIAEFIVTGLIPRRTQPMVADVLLTMNRLGINQDRAVIVLGGTP